MKKLIWTTVLIAAAVGLISSIIGAIVLRYYGQYVPLVSGVRISEDQQRGDIVINDPRKVIVEQDVRVAQVAQELRDGSIVFYRSHQSVGNPLADIFVPSDALAQGMTLTSDGWVVVPRAVKIDQSVIAVGGNTAYAVEKVVPDERAGILFVKIQASNLPVLKFADRVTLSGGQSVYVLARAPRSLASNTIADPFASDDTDRASFIRSSDGYDTYVQLERAPGPAFIGSPVITAAGEVAGIVAADGTRVVPSNYLKAISTTVLRQGSIIRPSLGVTYINLDQAVGAGFSKNVPDHGAYLVSIRPQSPLTKELKKGDVILSIEGQQVSAEHDLQDIIRDYQPGADISLVVSSAGQTKTVGIKLEKAL